MPDEMRTDQNRSIETGPKVSNSSRRVLGWQTSSLDLFCECDGKEIDWL